MASAIKQEVVDETEETFNDELKPGTTLMHGQYTIERFINAGGFGITYLARDSLDRKIVIKECFPGTFCRRSDTIVHARSRAHQAELKSIVRLFVQEARSLAKLDHPNIVGVHQVFEDNDTAYMALDFIEGRDLLDTLEDEGSKLQPKDVETMLIQILDAVEFIHQAEMLHRDISPDNILLDAGNKPVLIDFGAAREQATKASRVLSAMRVVKDGYSPQEFYIAGSDQSPSSDLYALGATFYHVITGDTPPNSQARLAAVASGEEDPYEPMTKLSGITGYEKYFLEAIDKALKVLPKDRLQSAKEWKDLILEEKRVEAALRAAQGDAEINTKIASLVSSAEDEPEPAKRETPKPTAPASTVQPRRVKSRVKTRVDANNASRRTRSKVAGLDAAERVALAGAGHSEKKKSKTGLLLASVALVALIAGGVVVTQTGLLTSSDVTPSDEQTESVDTGQATVAPPAASQQETDTSVASAPSPIDGRVQPTEVDQVDAGEAVEPVNSVVANRGQTESASADTAAPDPTSPNEAAAAPTAPSEKTEQVAVADQQTEPSEPTDVITETPVPNASASTIADTTEAERTTPAQTIAETETPAASENASAPERLTATETEQPLEQPGPDTVTGSAEANLADGPVAVPTPLSPSNGEKADRVASDQDSANIAVAEQTPVNIATSETARATVAEQAPAAAIDQSAADVAVAEQTPESVTAEQTPVVTVPEAAPESVAAADRSTDTPAATRGIAERADSSTPSDVVTANLDVAADDVPSSNGSAALANRAPSGAPTSALDGAQDTLSTVEDTIPAPIPVSNRLGSSDLAVDSIVGEEVSVSSLDEPVIGYTPIEEENASAAGPFVLSGWTVDLPFTVANGTGVVIASTEDTAEPWMVPGTEIVSVNGQPISQASEISPTLRETMSIGEETSVTVAFGLIAPGGTVEETLLASLPVAQEFALLNGTRFKSEPGADGWTTSVVHLPDEVDTDLQVGDIIRLYMQTNETFDQRHSIRDFFERELSAGRNQFSFAVHRNDAMWVTSFKNANNLDGDAERSN